MSSSGIITLPKMPICLDLQALPQLFASRLILFDSMTTLITFCMPLAQIALIVKYLHRLIIADGQVTPNELQETKDAIVEASRFPLSIVMVGVGVGLATSVNNDSDSCRRMGRGI